GEMIKVAHVAAPLPSLYTDLRAGEMILFDDGKIEGQIESVSQDEIQIKITHARQEGDKLKSEKGINLPQSNLRLRGLTSKDKEDLRFVVRQADIINMSFVNEPEDIQELLEEMESCGVERKPGIIIKIETQKGVVNLPGILIKAMQHCPVGVMIARGDLAVECGWNHLAEVQEEILRICEAAHIPNVWATQVLESVAKKGRPSRAEISDAASAQRAECVMLNKGPYILEAIRILKEILHSMQAHQDKKAPMLPVLKVPQIFNVSGD
ncbi:MAG: pyruvate kinase, partial [Bacteroidota bacterium]